MDWNFLPNWLERLISARARQRAIALKVRHRALLLRRQLAASLEEWGPNGPTGAGDLARWAAQKFAAAYGNTEPAVGELVDLSAEAAYHMQQAIITARDHYYAAADLVNPLITPNGLSVSDANRTEVERKLQQAVERVQGCISSLSL